MAPVGEIINVAAGEGTLPPALTETEKSGLRTGGYLADGPAIDAVEDDETVHFVLTNRKQGIAIQRGTTRHVLPDSRYQTVVVVTDRRVVALVGKVGGDEQVTLDLPEITDVATATKGGTGRLTVDAADGTTLSVPTDASGLSAVASYLRSESGGGTRSWRARAASRSLRGLFGSAIDSAKAFERDRVAGLLPTLDEPARGGADAADDGSTGEPPVASAPRPDNDESDTAERSDRPDRETAIDDILRALAKTDWRARGAKPESPFDLLAEREDELVGVVVNCPADGRVDHGALRRCEMVAGAAGTDTVMLATTADVRAADARLAAELGVRLRDVETLSDTADPPTIEAVTEMVATVLSTAGWSVRPEAAGPFDLLADSGDDLLGVVVHGPEDGTVRSGIEHCHVVAGAAGTDAVMLATTGTVRAADERLADELGVRLVESDSLAQRHVTAIDRE